MLVKEVIKRSLRRNT